MTKAAERVAIVQRGRSLFARGLTPGSSGPAVAGPTLAEAVFAIEELEETAKPVLLTRGLPVRILSSAQITGLRQVLKKD